MEDKKYTYDAFISYRHTEPDKYIAELLHKEMESFRIPGNIKKERLKRAKIERVFRDKEELPLTSNLEDPIIDALRSSEYLIVICSPRLKESIWCKKEIQTFIELHGRGNVLAVLAEGEPEDSFPSELLYNEQGEPVEPLAADLRGSTKKEIKKAMKSEVLRLLAPMFGLGYDDLKQRHREQKIRKIVAACAVGGILGIAFGAYSTATAIKINHQAQMLARHQAYSLADEAESYRIKSDRVGAISCAYQALTSYEGIDMPYTPQAERALAKCMNVYDSSSLIRATCHFEMPGIIERLELSPDKKLVMAADNLGNISVVNIPDKELVLSKNCGEAIFEYGFCDDESIYYISENGDLFKVNISDGSDIMYQMGDLDFAWSACASGDFTKLIVNMGNECRVINVSDLSDLYTLKDGEKPQPVVSICAGQCDDVCYIVTREDERLYINCWDMLSGVLKSKTEIPFDDDDVCKIKETQDHIYIMGNEIKHIYSGSTMLACLDKATNRIVFNEKYKGIVANDIVLSDGDFVLVMGSESACLINTATGENVEEFDFGAPIAYSKLTDEGSFLLYTGDGSCHLIDALSIMGDTAIQAFECSDVIQLELGEQGFAGVRKNDNKIIIYGILFNAEAEPYDGEEKEKIEGLALRDAIDYGNEVGLLKASFIDSVVECEEGDLLVANYIDDRMAVYRKSTGELLCEDENEAAGRCKYLGKAGEYYAFEVGYMGYLLDGDGNVRAQIPNISGVTADGKRVVVYGKDLEQNSAMMSVPAYTTNELLAKTKRYLDTVLK